MKCEECGSVCCRLGGAVASRTEVVGIVAAGYQNYFERVAPDVYITRWYNGGVCPYLDGTRCSIYEMRPLRCRAFPVFQMDDGAIYLALCPLASSMSKRDIDDLTELLIQSPVDQLSVAGEYLRPHSRVLQRRLSRFELRRLRSPP